MPAIQRKGDVNTADAAITEVVQGTVFIDGIPAAVDGSTVADHGRGSHSSPKTANGSASVFIAGKPVNRTGDADTCGHTRTGGSPTVSAD